MAERLAEILGKQYWTAQVMDAATANGQASARMAQGRPAVAYHDEDGHWFVAWGVKA